MPLASKEATKDVDEIAKICAHVTRTKQTIKATTYYCATRHAPNHDPLTHSQSQRALRHRCPAHWPQEAARKGREQRNICDISWRNALSTVN